MELWDLSEKEPRQVSNTKGHGQLASCCFFAPDDKSFFSTGGGYNPSGEHLAVQWDGATGAKLKAWRLARVRRGPSRRRRLVGRGMP